VGRADDTSGEMGISGQNTRKCAAESPFLYRRACDLDGLGGRSRPHNALFWPGCSTSRFGASSRYRRLLVFVRA